MGWELNIRISSPAGKRGASAKERSGVRKSSVHAAEEEIATNCGFGDVDLNRSLCGRFSGTPAHFVGRPLSMANLESFEMFCIFNLWLDLFGNFTGIFIYLWLDLLDNFAEKTIYLWLDLFGNSTDIIYLFMTWFTW